MTVLKNGGGICKVTGVQLICQQLMNDLPMIINEGQTKGLM